MVIIQPKPCGTVARCRPVGDLRSTRDLCQGSSSVGRQEPWHLRGLRSPSTRPASWASEVETQEVCQPLGVISFLQLIHIYRRWLFIYFLFKFKGHPCSFSARFNDHGLVKK